MKQLKILVIGSLAALVTPVAFAGPIFFDFSNVTGSDSHVSSYSQTVGGVTATITGWGYNGSSGPNGTSYDVYLDDGGNMDGIGVYSGYGDADDLDGWGVDEMLLIEFDMLVTMTDIRFLDGDHNYSFSSGDDFDLWAGGSMAFNETGIEANDINGWVSTGNLTASSFWLGADGGNDTFYLQGINVNASSDPQVPEPGLLALMGLGLFGMGISRRKKKTA